MSTVDSERDKLTNNYARWRENLMAFLLFLALLGLIILTAGGAEPFVYGRF